MMNLIGELVPALLVVGVVTWGFVREVPVFSVFIAGAKKGIASAVGILPTLIGILVAITMLSASGALDAFAAALGPLCRQLGIPGEILPLALLRPISGSGANAAVIQLFEQHGPDSVVGKMASVLSSASETTFYAVSVYFAGRSYKRLYYTVPVALLGDFAAVVFSVAAVNLFG